ncbi:histidine kinase [Brooklawnia sp.]|uniref:sensor histidine kinase n=1 Tax=Brooklawnia sp. TaxID=2699740 RepID=UPI003120155C
MADRPVDAEGDWDDIARRLWPIRDWLARHPRGTEWAVVAGCAAMQTLTEPIVEHPARIPVVALTALPLAWRRRHPATMLIIAVVAGTICSILWQQNYVSIPFAFALYTVANLQGPRRALLSYGLGVAIPITATLASYLHQPARTSPTLLDAPAIIALAIGLSVRAQRQRARLLAIIWDERAERARITERARIAADMHDVTAHSLSTMVALANGAASAWAKHPQRSAEAMAKVSEIGRGALTEMNRTLQLFPDTDTSTDPATTQQSLEDLIEVFRSTGMPVRFTRHGDLPPADPELQLTIYRIIQEGLTNALRYAQSATRIDVEVHNTGQQIDITITDNATNTHTSSVGSGRGLYGIAARTQRFNGTSHAGPRPQGGWRTHAILRTRHNAETPPT